MKSNTAELVSPELDTDALDPAVPVVTVPMVIDAAVPAAPSAPDGISKSKIAC